MSQDNKEKVINLEEMEKLIQSVFDRENFSGYGIDKFQLVETEGDLSKKMKIAFAESDRPWSGATLILDITRAYYAATKNPECAGDILARKFVIMFDRMADAIERSRPKIVTPEKKGIVSGSSME